MVKYGLKTDYGWHTNYVYDSVKQARKIARKHVLKYPGDKVIVSAWYKPYERYKDQGVVMFNNFNAEVLYRNFDRNERNPRYDTRIVKQDGSLGINPAQKYRKESLTKTVKRADRKIEKNKGKKQWSPFGL